MDYKLLNADGTPNIEAQRAFMLDLGRRLNEWVWPGSEHDVWLEGRNLITADDEANTELQGMEKLFNDGKKRKFLDVLMARLIRIAHGEKRTLVPFIQTAAQRHYSENCINKNIVLKSGKIGFSTLIALRLFLKTITRTGINTLLVSFSDESSKLLFAAVTYALQQIPAPLGPILRDGILRTGRSSVNEIFFPELNSRFFVQTAGNKNVAVSSAIQYLHCSEVSRWQTHNPAQILVNLLGHMVGDDREVHMESRPFGDFGVFYDRYWQAKRGESDFKAHFYEWYWDPSHSMPLPDKFELTPEEIQQQARYAKRYSGNRARALGLPPVLYKRMIAWYRDMRRLLRDKMAQEYAENEVLCFLGSGDAVFSVNAIADIMNRNEEPIETFAASGREGEQNGVWVWKKPEPGRKYVLFCDTAGGLAQARTAFEILDRDTLEQVAEYCGRIPYDSQASLLKDWAAKYNDALLAFENNHGKSSSTISVHLKGTKNLYWHIERDKTRTVGWPTDSNRDDMLDRLGKFVEDNPHLIKSPRLAQELKTAERRENKVQSQKGHTFDIVMAFAGALAVHDKVGRAPVIWFDTVETSARTGVADPNAQLPGSRVTDTGDIGWVQHS